MQHTQRWYEERNYKLKATLRMQLSGTRRDGVGRGCLRMLQVSVSAAVDVIHAGRGLTKAVETV